MNLDMFTKKLKIKNMTKDVISCSIVILEKQDDYIETSKKIMSQELRYNQPVKMPVLQELATAMTINTVLKENKINEIATPHLIPLRGVLKFKSPSFEFILDGLKFSIIQTTIKDNNLFILPILKSFIEKDVADTIKPKIQAIGINYIVTLDIADEVKFLNNIFTTSITGENLQDISFLATYRKNDNLIINIEVYKALNSKWVMSFNANHTIVDYNAMGNIVEQDCIALMNEYRNKLISANNG